jgi:YidC/Oxa1 family membrane protein insertase
VQDSIARATQVTQKSTKATPLPTRAKALVADTSSFKGPFAALQKGDNTPVILENENIKVTLSPKGARVSSVELKKFKTYQGKPLIQFEGDANKFGFLLRNEGSFDINQRFILQ